MSVKFRFSWGMALLACPRSYWQVGGAAQQSIGKIAQTQKVVERADKLSSRWRTGSCFEVRPFGGDQRLAAVRQNEHELQAGRHARLPENFQRLSFKWVMRTGDRHPLGKLLTVGSVSWCPSTRFRTNGW